MKIGFIFAGQGEKDFSDFDGQIQSTIISRSLKAANAVIESGIKPDATCGLSLGEYASLVIAGCVDEDTVKTILNYREKLMTEALENSETAMFVTRFKDFSEIARIENTYNLELTNFNSDHQIVFGGKKSDIEVLLENEPDYKSILILPTIGVFHSSYLKPASEEYQKFLKDFSFKKPEIDLYTNATKVEENRTKNSKVDNVTPELLAKQMCTTSNFKANIEDMLNDDIRKFYVFGGNAPYNLIRSIAKSKNQDKEIEVVNA